MSRDQRTKKAVKQGRSPTLEPYWCQINPYFSYNIACCTTMTEVGIKFAPGLGAQAFFRRLLQCPTPDLEPGDPKTERQRICGFWWKKFH